MIGYLSIRSTSICPRCFHKTIQVQDDWPEVVVVLYVSASAHLPTPVHYYPTCLRSFAACMQFLRRLITGRPMSIATVLFASSRLDTQLTLQSCDSSPLFVREAGRAFGHWRRLVTASVAIDRRQILPYRLFVTGRCFLVPSSLRWWV
jgi:hypothetical protein